MDEFAPIFEHGLTTEVFIVSTLMLVPILAFWTLLASSGRVALKPLMLKAGMAFVALAIGATAIQAWQGQTRALASVSTIAEGNMSDFIRELHNSPLAHGLPVQTVENYN
jgi:hypothetical protein